MWSVQGKSNADNSLSEIGEVSVKQFNGEGQRLKQSDKDIRRGGGHLIALLLSHHKYRYLRRR